ncbi:MAG: mercury transporter MerT [Phycisphaerales bacterium]|nr:mercury transporter MerT [Phycisphaerales bacterium]
MSGAAPSRAAADDKVKKGLISGLSVLGAIGASACCVIPFVLFALGISGAWIGNLTALAPYKPFFVTGTLAFLGLGFYLVYRRPKAAACADGSYCAHPASHRVAKTGLWTATVLVLLAMTFSYWFPLFVET